LLTIRHFHITMGKTKDEYEARINAFLRDKEGRPRRILSTGDHLEMLFKYTRGLYEEIPTNRHERDVAVRARTDAEMKANLLRGEVQRLARQLATSQEQARDLSREKSELEVKHASTLQQIAIERSRQTAQWETEKQVSHLKYKSDIGELTLKHSNQVNKLVSQLLVNSDDNASWTDDKLKSRFQQLQNKIENIASPVRKELRVSGPLNPQIDPTNFMGRVKSGKAYILLRSLIWSIYSEQYFSAPFGFGALGRDAGRKKLLDLFLTWRNLIEPKNGW
jgi:hypothetical protein